MNALFAILIGLVCLLLILIILVQKPKGGGLGSAFGGSANMLGGVQKTNQFLDKATWGLAIALLVLVLATNIGIVGSTSESQVDESSAIDAQDVNSAPSFQDFGTQQIETDMNTEEQPAE